MSSSPIGICHPIMKENALMKNTIEILDDEKQSILSEVLKCHVCLELPRGKQVRICEKGHHFCLTCHSKMKVCGICRAKLLKSRNSVVQKLVAKLALALEVPGFGLPLMDSPPNLRPGTYQCLHWCSAKVPPFQMLSHLRSRHAAKLLDNVRSNPYSRRFSFSCEVFFIRNGVYIQSAQVSDMGLFTVELRFSGSDFFGCVRILGDKTVSSLFRHQLIVKIPDVGSSSFLEFSVTDCPIPSYLDSMGSIIPEGKCLKIKGENLLERINLGNAMTVLFSVWKISESKKISAPSVACVPERHLLFKNDRRTRRNRNRNIRRKRLKKKLRNALASDESSKALLEGFCNLNL